MNHDILFDFRATNEDRKGAKTLLEMMINMKNFKESDSLCSNCQKVIKSCECPHCKKGVCKGCMVSCKRCNDEYCHLCMTIGYNGSEKYYLCPKCSE